ncbi:MAG: adenylate/guanylate cyclase domain-containing protein [Desulfobacterales bacterium]|nr:MAG: adenylate/guanylate cyclase domain-containing protein [Desulfobacterales bacterium]
MDLQAQVKHLRQELKQSEHIQNELDRRVFYLKTLYDVSKDIFSSVEPETILRNFLLMAMGNFGATEGFILEVNASSGKIQHFVEVGLEENDVARIISCIEQRIQQGMFSESIINEAQELPPDLLPASFVFVKIFTVESDCPGIFGLGPKLISEAYTDNDRELLDTLVNNLVVALNNARSFEKIKKLNRDLAAKNIQLQKALNELKAAMRKVEILESIKLNLSKFLPTTVTKLIELSPTGESLEAKERDVSVLFLDIEGYTKITEDVGATEVNALVEKYFSVFMDAIYENNGDIVETAGDGLMVLFLTDDEAQNALEAVKAAQTIREKACAINAQCSLDSDPVVINIGISSGQAFVGAAKFDSYTGSRWAYTSHGTTVNVAARICSHASGGAVLVSRNTAERAQGNFSFKPLGKYALKNLSEEVDIFALDT